MAKSKEDLNKISRNKLTELLKIKNIPDDIEEIKELPIIALKGIDVQTNHIILSSLGTVNIKDLATIEITPEHKKQLRQEGIPATSVDKWIAASKIINNIEEIEEESIKKIIFMGLDNAGKTSIIKLLTQSYGMEAFSDLSPTEGVERHEIVGPASSYAIWDFGGQELYRRLYLDDPEKYLMGIDLFFYVVDIQDKDRFHQSYNFFKKIIEVLKFLKESPEINILLHKFDPELENNPNAYELLNQVQMIFKDVLEGLNYEFFTTSIFNSLPTGETLVNDLKGFLKGGLKKTSETKNYEDILDIVESMMDIFIKFSVQIEDNQNKIAERLRIIEQRVLEPSEEIEKLKEIKSKISVESKPDLLGTQENKKSKINKELKSLFDKKISDIS
ncbi:MAG: hypothetical protein GF329_07800 [Candidatus Lokiarchaeota archaeon]|nr:hypothetical protein [Candidatus Lokiarchaeota archaeon]